MAATTLRGFQPKLNPFSALLNQIYQAKFSRNVPLVVVLLSAVYTVYRTHHYLTTALHLEGFIGWPTALFLEALVLGASASTFLATRAHYLAELTGIDTEISRYGVWLSLATLGVALIAMLVIAGADAFAVTQSVIATVPMVLVQFTQAAFIVLFLIQGNLDERERLRKEVAEYQDEQIRTQATTCRYCKQAISHNNRARHEASCALRPR